MPPIPLRLLGWTLVVPPFRLERHGLAYVSPAELEIDLEPVRPGAYRVLAVQSFHVEDTSPDLERCAAGVFLARRRSGGRWEEPEAFPVECRTLGVLGYLEVAAAPRLARAS
jgi:hypothetical protein